MSFNLAKQSSRTSKEDRPTGEVSLLTIGDFPHNYYLAPICRLASRSMLEVPSSEVPTPDPMTEPDPTTKSSQTIPADDLETSTKQMATALELVDQAFKALESEDVVQAKQLATQLQAQLPKS